MKNNQPLALKMRPTTLDDIAGQQDLIAENKLIWSIIHYDAPTSLILYGPPGSGKTTLANVIASSMNYRAESFNAATDSKSDLQKIIKSIKKDERVFVIIDEIHRLDKAKQDYLLSALEAGTILIIGTTTENPYISVNPALRSRVMICEIKRLTPEDIKLVIIRALKDKTNGLGNYNIKIDDDALIYLSQVADGDVRFALNTLQLVVLANNNDDSTTHINLKMIKDSTSTASSVADRDGDAHYNTISAFQKSLRGSDVDAALLYLAMLINAGDLKSICRRLIVCAYEDVGTANPDVCQRVVQAVKAAEYVGLPEARIPLADAVIDVSLANKSNAGLLAIDKALRDVKDGKVGDIPNNLKDSFYPGAKELGRGQTYKYPHDYPGHWVIQQYLPDNLKDVTYYQRDNDTND